MIGAPKDYWVDEARKLIERDRARRARRMGLLKTIAVTALMGATGLCLAFATVNFIKHFGS